MLDTMVLMAFMKDQPRAEPVAVEVVLRPEKLAPWLDFCEQVSTATIPSDKLSVVRWRTYQCPDHRRDKPYRREDGFNAEYHVHFAGVDEGEWEFEEPENTERKQVG